MDEWNDRYGLFRRQQADGGQSGGIPPFRGDGPPARHEDPGLRLERLLQRERSGLPQGMVSARRRSVGWWDLTRCSPASPGWRAYFLPRMLQILEDYELDGLYNDWGYVPNAAEADQGTGPGRSGRLRGNAPVRRRDDRSAVPHLLGGEAPRRHLQGARRSLQPAADRRTARSTTISGSARAWTTPTAFARRSRTITPYVVPCIHGSVAKVEGDSEHFPALDSLHAVPLAAGRTAADRRTGA